MDLKEAVAEAKEGLLSMMDLELSSVIGASNANGGWRVMLELIERKAIPDAQDLLGVYEVRLDESGHMKGYDRQRIRRRIDLEEVVE